MQTRTKCKLIDLAFSWHGGMSSPLYSFASTRTVHSEEHRQNLAKEIAGNIDYVAASSQSEYTDAAKRKEIAALSKLNGLATDAVIGVEVVSNEQMTEYWRKA